MKLFLMRHGDACDGPDDAQRPLSRDGLREAKNVGAFLAMAEDMPSLICHSSFLRARQTAEIVAEKLGLPRSLCERSGLRPSDPVECLAREIAGKTYGNGLLIIGHLPFMANLASYLLTGMEDAVSVRFTTGALLCLERSGCEAWTQRYHVSAKLIARFLQND